MEAQAPSWLIADKALLVPPPPRLPPQAKVMRFIFLLERLGL